MPRYGVELYVEGEDRWSPTDDGDDSLDTVRTRINMLRAHDGLHRRIIDTKTHAEVYSTKTGHL